MMDASARHPHWLTLAQLAQRRLQALRPSGWRALLSAVTGAHRPDSDTARLIASQVQSLFEIEVIQILTCAMPLHDFLHESDTPLARSAYQVAASRLMAFDTGFVAIEAMKQVGASICLCSQDPQALGVDLRSLSALMQSMTLSAQESACLSLVQEALSISTNPTLRFTVVDSVTVTLADTLNCALNSDVFQARAARRASLEIELATRPAPSRSDTGPSRL